MAYSQEVGQVNLQKVLQATFDEVRAQNQENLKEIEEKMRLDLEGCIFSVKHSLRQCYEGLRKCYTESCRFSEKFFILDQGIELSQHQNSLSSQKISKSRSYSQHLETVQSRPDEQNILVREKNPRSVIRHFQESSVRSLRSSPENQKLQRE